MSHRGKRPMPENEAFPPTKKRKGRPSSSQTSTYVEEEPNPNSNNVSPSQSWQPRSLMDLKMSSIYNRSAAEAPAELFRKDLISAMKLPDSEPLSLDEYWVISDQWKQEWERGVQVPVNPDSLPEPSVAHTRRILYEKGRSDFKLPKNKFIHVMKTDNFSHDQHYLSNTPALADSVCFYDLDQSDDAWLKLYNRERHLMGLSLVTEEQFERVIEELESRCWNKIHAIMKNEEGLGIEFDENVICDVCRSPDSEEANEMVFCDNCNICVHQACYGITAIPSGQWLCRTCSMGQKPDCVLCPNKGGAMKSTRSGQKWAHVSCALWIPEVSIGSVDRMEPITKISNIPPSRWALICVLCRERVGACIQCSVKTCKTAYHVTCAFQHGLEMRAIIEDESAEDGVKLRSYCQKHGVNKGKKDHMKSSTASSANKTSNNTSGSEDEVGADNESHHSSTVSNKALSSVGTAIGSIQRKYRKEMTSEERNHARVLRLTEVEAEFDKHVNIKDISCHLLDIDQEGINAIYYYWILKRKSGNNRPLLPPKSDDVEILSHTQEQADVEKLKMFVHLRQDLERVRNLCYMVSRREKLSRSFFKMREQTFHKQISVLADMKSHHRHNDDQMQNYETVIMAVLAANHGSCIYDQLYSSVSDTPEGDAAGSSSSSNNNKDINTLLDNLLGENILYASSSAENICGGSGVEVITKNKNSKNKQQKLKNRRNSTINQNELQKQKQNSNSTTASASKKNNNNKTNSLHNQKRRPSALYNGVATLTTRSGNLYGSSSSATTSSCTSDDDTDHSSNTNHSVKMLMPPPKSTSSSCSYSEDEEKMTPTKPLPKSKKNKMAIHQQTNKPSEPARRGRPPKLLPKNDKARLTDSSSDENKGGSGGNSGDNLRQFERVMFGGDMHLTDSNESDELDVPSKNLQSFTKNKMLSAKIYSSDTDDSSAGGGSSFTTDKEKTDNAATSDSQQHLVRTKAAMKEFNMHAAAASTIPTDLTSNKRRQSTDKKSHNKDANKNSNRNTTKDVHLPPIATTSSTTPDKEKFKKKDNKAEKKRIIEAEKEEVQRKKLELEKEKENQKKKLEIEKEREKEKEREREKEREKEKKKVELEKEKDNQRKKVEMEKELQRKKLEVDQEKEIQRKKLEVEKETQKKKQEVEKEKEIQKKKMEQEKENQRKKLEIEKEKENQKKASSADTSPDIPVDLLVVPQRQAAKKAFENLTRSGTISSLPTTAIGSTNITSTTNLPSRREHRSGQSDDTSLFNATKDDPRTHIKENLKESNKDSSRKEANNKKSASILSKPLKTHQKEKSGKLQRGDDDDLDREEEEQESIPAVSKTGKAKLNKIENSFNFAYVPQRQAAKKAQEHIKSGLGKVGEGAAVVVPATENRISSKPSSQQHSKRSHGKKDDSKTVASDVSSSENSSSSSNSDSNDSHDDDNDDVISNSKARGGKKKNEGTERNNDLPFLDKAAKPIVSGSGTSESSDTDDDSDESSSSADSSRSNLSASSKRKVTANKKLTTINEDGRKKKSISSTDKGKSPDKKKQPSISTVTPTKLTSPPAEGAKPRVQRPRRDSNRTGSIAVVTSVKEETERPTTPATSGIVDDGSNKFDINRKSQVEVSTDKHGPVDSRKRDLVETETKLISPLNEKITNRKRKSRYSSSTNLDDNTPIVVAEERKAEEKPEAVQESPSRKKSTSPRKSPVKSRRESIASVTPIITRTKLDENIDVQGDSPLGLNDNKANLERLASPAQEPEAESKQVLIEEIDKKEAEERFELPKLILQDDTTLLRPVIDEQKIESIVIDDDDDDDIKPENKSIEAPPVDIVAIPENKIDEKYYHNVTDAVSNISAGGHCNLFDINSEDLFQSAVEPINDDAFTISNDSLSAGGFSLSSSATATALKKDQEDEEDTARETLNLVEKLRQKKRKCSSAGVHVVDEKSSSSTSMSLKEKTQKDEQPTEKEIVSEISRDRKDSTQAIIKESPIQQNEQNKPRNSSIPRMTPPTIRPEEKELINNEKLSTDDDTRRWIPVVAASCNLDITPNLEIKKSTVDEMHESNSNQSDINKMQTKLLNSVIDYDDDKPMASPYHYQRKWMECEIIAKRRSVSSSPASSNSDMVIDHQTSTDDNQIPRNSNNSNIQQQQTQNYNDLSGLNKHNKSDMLEHEQQLFANLTEACQQQLQQQSHRQQRNENSLLYNNFMGTQQHHHQFSGSGSALTPFAPSGGMNIQMPFPSPGQALYPPHMNNQSNLFTATLNNLSQHQQLQQQLHPQQHMQQQLQQQNLNSNINNNNIDYTSTTSAAFTSSSQNLAFTASIISPTIQQQHQQHLQHPTLNHLASIEMNENINQHHQQHQQQHQHQQQSQQPPSIFDNKKNKPTIYNNSSSMNMHLQEENRMNAPNDLFSGAGTGSVVANSNLNTVSTLGDYNNQSTAPVMNKPSPNKYPAEKVVQEDESFKITKQQQQQQQKIADKKINEYEGNECNNKTSNKSKSSNAKAAKTPKASAQTTKAAKSRSTRGRGRTTSIHHHVPAILPFSDYGLMNENTMQHIAGTVYDFEDEIEREEENRPTRYRKKSKEFTSLDPALRSLASSGDTTPAAASMSPKLPNVNIQLKVRNSDFKSITSLHNSLNNTSLLETNNSIISPIIDMVLPGPVDMRTYSDDYDTAATAGGDLSVNVQQPAYTNPLARFSNDPTPDVYEDIKELQSALNNSSHLSMATSKTSTVNTIADEQPHSPTTKSTITPTIDKTISLQDSNTTVLPVDEISIDSDCLNNPKVSLSNQLKLKIKGPLAHSDYYSTAALSSSSSTTTSSTFNHHANTIKHTIEVSAATDHIVVGNAAAEPNLIASSHHGINISQSNTPMPCIQSNTSGGSSNLRRMRKKELLRQYWTQDMNMDEQNGFGQIGSEHQSSAAVHATSNRVGIPKAVDSMSSLPSNDDYNYDEFIDKKKRKISRELRLMEAYLQDPNSNQERRRSTSSSNGGNGGNNNINLDTSDYMNKRRVRYNRSSAAAAINASPASIQLITPKLKIKIGDEYTNETPMIGLRPPKKRINAAVAVAVPSLEDLKRESMIYRKQMMANFDNVEKKSKKHSRSKEERREEKRKKKKEKKKQRVQIINNESEHSPKLIIKFGIRNKKSDTATATTSPATAAGQDIIAPIRLKISKKGINYVAKKSEDKLASQPLASVFVEAAGEDDLNVMIPTKSNKVHTDAATKSSSFEASDPLDTSNVQLPTKTTKQQTAANTAELGKCTDR